MVNAWWWIVPWAVVLCQCDLAHGWVGLELHPHVAHCPNPLNACFMNCKYHLTDLRVFVSI